jgi:putative spermidine/putrescine transport system ATP-binding protein
LSALDRNLRTALQLELRRIHRELGATFLFVTHDQDEAMTLSDRIALFNKGRIEQIGTPDALYNRPETLFAARFLGESNVFPLADSRIGAVLGWEDAQWRIEPGTVAARVEERGGAAALVVRPEAVALVGDAASIPAGANAIRARVLDTEYMGAHRTIILSLGAAGLPGRARIAASAPALNPGDSVLAWWSPATQRIVAVAR